MPEELTTTSASAHGPEYDRSELSRLREEQPQRFESMAQGEAAVDYRALLAEQAAENERLKGLLAAVHVGQSASTSQNSGTAAKLTAEQLSRKLAPYQLDRMTDGELASALGLEAAPSKADVEAFFGKGTHVEASRLMRNNPTRYYQLRGFGQLRRWV